MLVRWLRFPMQRMVDDAALRFSATKFLHVAVWAGKRNLISFVIPAKHQRIAVLETYRRGRHRASLCQRFRRVHI